ncbi:methylmalonyl-CoA mutase small subunit [Crossiella cryophila]|uniref:Methylmalonyl-CoA mutase small subunit n=1 Tax=Crossiella cryophila TaxID=43355 RepID=A0A7W7CBU4_9PSEU|nr:methylmalonyl-CoA mutase small subunit [Crossiella cryophila]MBB4677026.1 methylmalonyl-CoA mutase [Crossiella cryophila]
MTLPGEQLSLAAEFPQPGLEQWRELVAGVLRKSGVTELPEFPESRLSRTTYDGIKVNPLYTRDDAAPQTGLPGLAPYTRGSRPEGAVAGGWDIRQRHSHPDPATAREAVLADLESGVSSLWLTLGGDALPIAALPQVLDGVYLDLAPIVLDAGADTEAAAEALFALAAQRGVADTELTGNLGADPLGLRARTGADTDVPAAAALAARVAAKYPGLRALTVDATVFHDAGGSDAEELGASLAVATAYLRALTEAGLDIDAAFGQLEFRYAATADQFLTIAKFRAARRLWARVGEVCQASEPAQRQHAVTSTAMMTARDPWVNMLRTTLACFGAGVGGADSVTVQPFDACLGLPDDFARRIARNTQSLLVEESHVARVIDPAGGSWYVERLTEDLATAAWAFFTEIERAGGFETALADGLIESRLTATQAKRAKRIAHRKDAITGVSEFPNLTEKLPVRQPNPAPPTGGLPRVRYAQDFEDLRTAADNAPQRPTVFLATIGSVAAYTARSTFAGNLFQAGGIATPDSGPGTDAAQIAAAFKDSGASVVCLCGNDKAYAEHAAPIAEALKAAGAQRIWLAGKPGERAESDKAAGIDDYIFAGCDALGVLRGTLSELGVAF